MLSIAAFAQVPQPDDNDKPKRPTPKAQPKSVKAVDEDIPDPFSFCALENSTYNPHHHEGYRLERSGPSNA